MRATNSRPEPARHARSLRNVAAPSGSSGKFLALRAFLARSDAHTCAPSPRTPSEDPRMSPAPVRVAVTGAAGQIGYALVFRIASGQMFGPERPVALNLIEVPVEKPMQALKGVVMELEDCAFPLLRDVVLTSDPKVGFRDASWALLVGAKPRGPGMERNDLIKDNGGIFTGQ